MPDEVSHPGVYVEEIPNNVKPIEGVTTSTAAFAGWSSKGPTEKAELIESWTDFENKFGGLDQRSVLGYSVNHFFENGGNTAYVVRIASGDDIVLKPNTPEFENALLPTDGKGGLYLLDDIDLFNLLCVPGETRGEVITKLQKFCHERRAFVIVDCAESAVFDDVKSGPGNISGDDAPNSAFYFPWVIASDPLQNSSPREFPPCGFVAGVIARTDANRGVWKSPAGLEALLKGATGIAPNKKLTESENGVLNRKGINCIRVYPSPGTILWGARTLRGADEFGSEWKYVSVRRLELFIEESIRRGLQWAVFEPNDEPLWAQMRSSVDNFLLNLWRQGALLGITPKEAYFVHCGKDTTTQSDLDAGVVNIEIGFAPLKPAEFIIIRIQQMAGQTQPDPYPHIDTLAELIEAGETSEMVVLSDDVSARIDQIVGDVKAGARGNARFAGEKGTGKRLAAGLIANQLGSKLYRVDLSSVASKYIGETEKNLKQLFASAEAAGATLLFDEADALFGKRGDVKDAHDRYANIEVNSLLERMEKYGGLAILTTNKKADIDEAFLQRLRHQIDFPRPEK